MAANEVTIHVKAVDKTKVSLNAIEQTVKTSFANRMARSFNNVGTSSAGAFAAGFIKTITFGQVGGGFAQAAVRMAPQAAKMGGVLGAGVAAALLLQLTNALTAGLPLILGGAILAAPLIHLWKTQTAEVDRLKSRAKDFIEFISAPLKVPFADALDAIGDGLDNIKQPVKDMMKTLGPALAPFTKGVMKGLENFIKALEPAMPSIAAGMKAWGDAAPKIGTALGKMIDKILKDPETTVQTVEDVTAALKDLAESSAEIISGLQGIAEKYGKLSTVIGDFEESTSKKEGGPLGGMWNATKRGFSRFKGWFENAFDSFRSWFESGFERLKDRVTAKAKSLVESVRNWFKKLPGWVSDHVRDATDKLKQRFNEAKTMATQKGREIVTGFINKFNDIVGRARTEAGKVKKAITDKFSGAINWLKSKGNDVIQGLWNGLTSKFKKVKDWVSGIAKWIKDHKGPISLDRQLLKPAGSALMGGLLEGLKFGFKGVGDFVYGAGSKVSDIIGKIKASGLGSFGNAEFGGFFGGRKPVPGSGNRHRSGYPWAAWAGDFPNPTGTPVAAWASGVIKAVRRLSYSYGHHIRMNHGLSNTLYAHLSRIFVKPGQFVKAGQVIGQVGSTGNSTGPHLHFERYARGGVIREPVIGYGQRSGKGYMLGENGPETVIPGVGRMGGVTINVHAPNYVGAPAELLRALVDAKRRGQLDVILR